MTHATGAGGLVALFAKLFPNRLPVRDFSAIFHPTLEYFSYFCTDNQHNLSLMLDRTQTIEKLKTTREYLDEHYGVHSMTLFGSLARNEQREDSDVDICVEMVPNLFNQAGVKNYLQELLGCDVDVVRMRERMNPVFKQQILKYGIRVY